MHNHKLLVKLILLISTLFSISTAFAHSLAITATSPFPAQVAPSATATALYTVTNTTSRVPFTVIDQSKLSNGLSMQPGKSCQITLQFKAPITAQTVTGTLIERAYPSADFVQMPVSIVVPSTPQLVSISTIPASATIATGATQQFSAIGRYSDQTTQNMTNLVNWLSSNTVAATISNTSGSNGLATANSSTSGQTTISASLNGIIGTSNLTIQQPQPVLASISISPPNAILSGSSTQQYTVTGTYSDSSTQPITTGVTWGSSNTAAATIDFTGLATTNTTTAGQSIISASTGGFTSSTLLYVAPAAYIPNFNNNTVQRCPITSSGTFSGCSTQTISGANTIYVYPLLSNGGLNTCSAFTNPLLSNLVQDIALNTASNMVYVARINSNAIAQCTADATTGALSGCSAFAPTGGVRLAGITYRADIALTYIADTSTNTIFQ